MWFPFGQVGDLCAGLFANDCGVTACFGKLRDFCRWFSVLGCFWIRLCWVLDCVFVLRFVVPELWGVLGWFVWLCLRSGVGFGLVVLWCVFGLFWFVGVVFGGFLFGYCVGVVAAQRIGMVCKCLGCVVSV